MKTTTREYLDKIGFSPFANAVSSAFLWYPTAEGYEFWKLHGGYDGRAKTSKARRKWRQLRKTAFRLGYRNSMKGRWNA